MKHTKDKNTRKTSVSQARSYEEAGEYWDNHDLSDKWDETQEAEFDAISDTSVHYFAVEVGLSEKLRRMARERGVGPQTLLNLWVQEKMAEAMTVSPKQ